MKDEWTDLADFLQEMIEKYYSSLDLWLMKKLTSLLENEIKNRMKMG